MDSVKEFETAKQAAQRLNCTVRAVQKWAKEGKLQGAQKVGRDWMIPITVLRPDAEVRNKVKKYNPLPLLNGSFNLGEVTSYINSIEDDDERNIATGEYYYYCGKAEEALNVAEPYLINDNPYLRLSAALIYIFANCALDRTHMVHFASAIIREELAKEIEAKTSPQLRAFCEFAAATVRIQFHIPTESSPLENHLRYLPQGLRMFGCYLLAYKAYLKKDYNRSLGIVDTALACSVEFYPVAAIHLYVMSTIDLMNVLNTEDAAKAMQFAWDTSKKDGLVMPFAEHHGLLQGMIEVFFKKKRPEEFNIIIHYTQNFYKGWYEVHKQRTDSDVADNLTTTEFTIAMLYNRNWKIKEIAAHMELSERTIKNYLQVVYEKLGINGKKGLEKYMLR